MGSKEGRVLSSQPRRTSGGVQLSRTVGRKEKTDRGQKIWEWQGQDDLPKIRPLKLQVNHPIQSQPE